MRSIELQRKWRVARFICLQLMTKKMKMTKKITEDDGVSGFKFERKPEEYTVDQLKRWLKYRGLKLSGKREDIVQRVRETV